MKAASNGHFGNVNAFDITGLGNRVIQSTFYNNMGDSRLYALQLANNTDGPAGDKFNCPQVFVADTDMYDIHYTNPFYALDKDNPNPTKITMISQPILDLNDCLFTDHTQTLVLSHGKILTGINYLPYETLQNLLFYAKKTPDEFLGGIDNASAKDFRSWLADRTHSSFTRNFGLFNPNISHPTQLGFFTKMIGFEKALGLSKYNRIEATVSPNQRYLLIAGNDASAGKLVLNVYHLTDDVFDKAGDYEPLYDRYYGYADYPNDPQKMTQNQIDYALDWLHELFYDDDLAFDINSLSELSHTEINYSDLVSLSGWVSGKFSFQGFAIDDNKNIYLSSGFGPNNDYVGNYNEWLLKIPNGGKNLSEAKRYDLTQFSDIMKKYFKNKYDSDSSMSLFTEPESLQLFDADNNSLMIAITMAIHYAKKPEDELLPDWSNSKTIANWNFVCQL